MSAIQIIEVILLTICGLLLLIFIWGFFGSETSKPDIRFCYNEKWNCVDRVKVLKVTKDKIYGGKKYLVCNGSSEFHNYEEFEVNRVFKRKKRAEKFYLTIIIHRLNHLTVVVPTKKEILKEHMVETPKTKKGGKKNDLVQKPTYKKSKS